MITLTAKMNIGGGENPNPFVLGSSFLGSDTLGANIDDENKFDYSNLISLDRKIIDRSDIQLPSYGVISNTGQMTFIDKNKRFLGYANNGSLVSGILIEIYLTDTLSKKSERVGIFYSDKWNYDNNNREVSVSLKDDLEEWQDIQVERINYDPRNPHKVFRTMADLYNVLRKLTPTKYKMLSFNSLDEGTRGQLERIAIPYPLLESGSLWAQWDKLCQVCRLHIHKNNVGQTVCR